jgi:hypothetical protein
MDNNVIGSVICCPSCKKDFIYTRGYHIASTTIGVEVFDHHGFHPDSFEITELLRKKMIRYSDGRQIEFLPFLPPHVGNWINDLNDSVHYSSKGIVETYPLISCPNCFTLLNVIDVDKKSVNLSDDKSLLMKKPLSRYPYFADLEHALKSYPKYEKLIRINLWRMMNQQQDYDFPKYKDNCLELIKLLDRRGEDRTILAEIYRNIGEFEKCLLVSSNSNSIDSIIINECLKGNKATVLIDGYWAKEEAKDKRWKVCPQGHCYKNVEHNCRWCGSTKVLSRVHDDTPTVDAILYVGKRNGQWVLTKDSNIEGQGDDIRNIKVEVTRGYKSYYHLDGKNPNPFYNNTIKLGDHKIDGDYLVKLCDKLIDSNLNEILVFL